MVSFIFTEVARRENHQEKINASIVLISGRITRRKSVFLFQAMAYDHMA